MRHNMTPRTENCRARSNVLGFTLIELLVVIAIIGILIVAPFACRPARERSAAVRNAPRSCGKLDKRWICI